MSILFTLSLLFFLGYSHACSMVMQEYDNEQERMNSDLITIANIESFKRIDPQSGFSDYDIIYNFKVQKIFKGDKNIKSFFLQDITTSSCDSGIYESGTYLLYLRQNSQKPYVYTISSTATLIKPTQYPVIPISHPLWNNTLYIAYYNSRKDLFHIRREIRSFGEEKLYSIKSRMDYYTHEIY